MPASNQLTAAALLAATGGCLDTVIYLAHGHVFANAMTGNTIFLGISVITADWHSILPHLTPILAYIAGVLAAHLLKALPSHPSAVTALLLESSALLLLSLFPGSFPQALFVAIAAFVSAFQVATFRRVGTFTYNSTFITGNLRDVVEGAYQHLTEPDPALRFQGRQKFRDLGTICLCFLLGATLGAWAEPRLHNHALWLTEPLLLAALLLTLRARQTA